MANAKLPAHLIPNAQLELVKDGHLFVVTSPKETAAHIGAFLDHAPEKQQVTA